MSDVRLMSERAKKVAKYIVENKATVRQAAKEFGISKSTVHKYVTEKLWYTDRTLYFKVRGVF